MKTWSTTVAASKPVPVIVRLNTPAGAELGGRLVISGVKGVIVRERELERGPAPLRTRTE